MSGPLRFARSLAPKLVVGGLLAAATSMPLAGGSEPIPPCSPDGVCLPNYESWGWYQTRWRPFPGDTMSGMPTPADQGGEEAEEQIGGPRLPTTAEEGQIGPKKEPVDNSGAAAPALPPTDATGPAAPAVEPAPDAGAAPPAEGAEPAAEPPIDALPPAEEAAPADLPDPTAPIDPFGAAPPAPPTWMIEPASYEPLPAVGAQAPATVGPPSIGNSIGSSINDAPNMQGDDAPPALPADLQSLFGATASRPTWMQAAASPVVLAQPTNLRAVPAPPSSQGVIQTSAEAPVGIQLINPASAVAAPTDEAGLQQAIYFEASDLEEGAAVALPPVE